MANNSIVEYIERNDLVFLWSGVDSKVFRIGNTAQVLKIYPELSLEEIQWYHKLHHQASRVLTPAGIRLPGNFSWSGQQVHYLQLRVLDLLACPIIHVSHEDFKWCTIKNQRWVSLNIQPIPTSGYATIIPYVPWDELYKYANTLEWKTLLEIASSELESESVPVVWVDDEFDKLHPINIKVFPPHNNWSISLVVTDIWASIRWTLALHWVLSL